MEEGEGESTISVSYLLHNRCIVGFFDHKPPAGVSRLEKRLVNPRQSVAFYMILYGFDTDTKL